MNIRHLFPSGEEEGGAGVDEAVDVIEPRRVVVGQLITKQTKISQKSITSFFKPKCACMSHSF